MKNILFALFLFFLTFGFSSCADDNDLYVQQKIQESQAQAAFEDDVSDNTTPESGVSFWDGFFNFGRNDRSCRTYRMVFRFDGAAETLVQRQTFKSERFMAFADKNALAEYSASQNHQSYGNGKKCELNS